MKLKGMADAWHDIFGQSDAQVAEQVSRDRIDILVDLALHTANNRLLLFAYKPAPVQVTMLGMPSTTGLDTIDYRLTDNYIDPPGATDGDYSERSIRLPHCYWCYQPPENSPPAGPLPAESRGFVTFSCMNRFSKISPPALEAWVQILHRLPTARFVLHALAGGHRDTVQQWFAARGIGAERLEFATRIALPSYFERYQQLDICLDPFPCSGGVSTMDALWMGVPVITLAGRTAVGRGGVSVLSNVGLPELIARTPSEYVDRAIALAQDLPRLAALRGSLRERMRASPLLDAPGYAAAMQAAFRQMWTNWCRS
jgi:predicted O-linked N-acetylglucosamine transferase (SPINDLY family)